MEKQSPSEKHKEMQETYVAQVVDGTDRREAARIAGYSDKTPLYQIERPGGPVDSSIKKALAERGINDSFLSTEYSEGIDMAKKDGAKNKDLNAHAQYLKQLAYLLGHGKNTPSVAVQINNNHAGPVQPLADLTPDGAREALQRVLAVIEVLGQEIGRRKSAGVSEQDIDATRGSEILAEPETCEGVVQSGGESQEIVSGGQP